jgi:hypothetical protein
MPSRYKVWDLDPLRDMFEITPAVLGRLKAYGLTVDNIGTQFDEIRRAAKFKNADNTCSAVAWNLERFGVGLPGNRYGTEQEERVLSATDWKQEEFPNLVVVEALLKGLACWFDQPDDKVLVMHSYTGNIWVLIRKKETLESCFRSGELAEIKPLLPTNVIAWSVRPLFAMSVFSHTETGFTWETAVELGKQVEARIAD